MSKIDKYLIFEISGCLYGVDLKYILKIKNTTKFYKLPAIGEEYLGIIELENRFIPVYNFEHKYGLDNEEKNAVIFIRYRTNEFAILITNLLEIFDIQTEEIFFEKEKTFTYIDEKKACLINLEEITEEGVS